MKLTTYREMATTAIQNPEEIPPYLAKKVQVPRRRFATRKAITALPRQYDRVEMLRRSNDYLLLVLDACRYDYFKAVFADWFTGSIEPIRSEGHDTFEYVRLCWPGEYEVPYLSGATPINSQTVDYEIDMFNELYNGYTPHKHLHNIGDVWADKWDVSLGTCPPWSVTDVALNHLDESQLVAHYFQPHAPYIGKTRLLGYANNKHARPHEGEPIDKQIWKAARMGEIAESTLRDAYQANLACALASVARLVAQAPHENIVIMGDHGEALGEYGVYSHPRTTHPHIRRIPWAEVDGVTPYAREQMDNNQNRERGASGDNDVATRLEQLGYI